MKNSVLMSFITEPKFEQETVIASSLYLFPYGGNDAKTQ